MYLDKSLQLAEEMNSYNYILQVKRLVFAYTMVVQKDRKAAISYLENNEDLKSSLINLGMANYYWNLGNIYKYAQMPDSALYYYSLAEPGLMSILDKSNEQAIYMEMAGCYRDLGKINEAIRYYTKCFNKGSDNLAINEQITLLLSQLHSKAGDFRKAFSYAQQHSVYSDSLNILAQQRNLTLLEMERENTKRQKDLDAQAQLERNKRNLQYMSITFAIAGLFFLLVLAGMFPVSKLSIRLMGYFTFICLFEFIVLLIDTYLHRLTNGEPLKQWLIKIFLIALLVPFQHFLEHGLIQFIQSKALIRLRSRLSIKNWWQATHAPTVQEAAEIEQDTAVL
jgi:tetratricopeptide (TPR) repeat protein